MSLSLSLKREVFLAVVASCPELVPQPLPGLIVFCLGRGMFCLLNEKESIVSTSLQGASMCATNRNNLGKFRQIRPLRY